MLGEEQITENLWNDGLRKLFINQRSDKVLICKIRQISMKLNAREKGLIPQWIKDGIFIKRGNRNGQETDENVQCN